MSGKFSSGRETQKQTKNKHQTKKNPNKQKKTIHYQYQFNASLLVCNFYKFCTRGTFMFVGGGGGWLSHQALRNVTLWAGSVLLVPFGYILPFVHV